jgi:hypothetical protein
VAKYYNRNSKVVQLVVPETYDAGCSRILLHRIDVNAEMLMLHVSRTCLKHKAIFLLIILCSLEL